jgi:hypothetical protein
VSGIRGRMRRTTAILAREPEVVRGCKT